MDPSFQRSNPRMYRVCRFEPGAIVPSVEFFNASSDEQAIVFACGAEGDIDREVWDMHRLVARVPAGHAASRRATQPVDGDALLLGS